MAKFRKKPVVIDAHRWDPQQKPTDIPDWLWRHLARYPENLNEATGCFDIVTLEGAMTAQPGDWVIKGVKGELYPCKPDIFEATYEPASPPQKGAGDGGIVYGDNNDVWSRTRSANICTTPRAEPGAQESSSRNRYGQ